MKINPIPEGFHTITPYLAVHHVKETIAFLKAAFDAKEVDVHSLPNGRIMNAELKIGNSMIMLGERSQDEKSSPGMLYMYVEDTDSVYESAVKAGGKVIMKPTDQFYGDRSGAVEDPSGNQWWIASRKENISNEEFVKRTSKMKG